MGQDGRQRRLQVLRQARQALCDGKMTVRLEQLCLKPPDSFGLCDLPGDIPNKSERAGMAPACIVEAFGADFCLYTGEG